MKKVLVCVLIVCVIGCMKEATPTTFEFAIGTIETTEHEELSQITYYDKNLNKVKEKVVKHAKLGTLWSVPVYQGGSVYVHTLRANIVIGLDFKNGEDSVYELDRDNNQGIAVSADKIIAVSNLNGVSYLSLYDKESNKKLKEANYDAAYASLVVTAIDKIYCFVTFFNRDPAKQNVKAVSVYVYDMELNELAKKDIMHMGMSPYKYKIIGNKLYFSNQASEQGEKHNLGIIDLVSDEVKKVELIERYPDDIIQLNDKELLISHTDMRLPYGTKIGIYNVETEKEEIIDIRRPINAVTYVNKILYVLTDDDYIVSYELQGYKLKQINEVKCERNKIHKISYISTIFGNMQAANESKMDEEKTLSWEEVFPKDELEGLIEKANKMPIEDGSK